MSYFSDMPWGPASALTLGVLLIAGGVIAGIVALIRAEQRRKREERRRLGFRTVHIYSKRRHW